jgi:hypothetical protein
MSVQTAPGWVFSLTGIINVLVSLKKDERDRGGQEGNLQQYEIIRRAYPRIETTLWTVHENANTDKLIDVLALGMYHIARVPDLYPYVLLLTHLLEYMHDNSPLACTTNIEYFIPHIHWA